MVILAYRVLVLADTQRNASTFGWLHQASLWYRRIRQSQVFIQRGSWGPEVIWMVKGTFKQKQIVKQAGQRRHTVWSEAGQQQQKTQRKSLWELTCLYFWCFNGLRDDWNWACLSDHDSISIDETASTDVAHLRKRSVRIIEESVSK